MGLRKYKAKRNFKVTSEPKGIAKKSGKELIFCIQKHHASHLHYDFRLESHGTLKSWAVPKGPSLNPKDKRLAVEVEDHPIDYATFEGDIPKGQYGAGHVIVWDFGTWTPPENVTAALKKGHLEFELHGQKLRGKWTLVRLAADRIRSGGGKKNWLLFKRQDEEARSDYDVIAEEPDSVLSKVKPAKKKRTKKAAASGKKKSKSSTPPPDFIKPQLAQLVDEVPKGENWLHEIKYDGYRTLCRINQAEAHPVRLITRGGLDWTEKYGPIAKQAEDLPVDNAILDGEIVYIDEHGHTDFQGLQNSLSEHKYARMFYYIFDLLFLNGKDLRSLPLVERKEILKKLLAPKKQSKLLYSEHWREKGKELFQQSCKLQLEGIVSKDGDRTYSAGRSPEWQKIKCSLRQEFVIGGFTDSESKDRPFAALLMGVNEKGRLRYTGKIGTGYTTKTLHDLSAKLKAIEISKSPFDVNSPKEKRIHWVSPKFVGEVEFKAWTGDGIIRQGSFQGLRGDKETRQVHEEIPQHSPEAKVKVTHPDRIVFEKTKTKKIELIDYYEAVYSRMKPFLADRPLSLLRCQESTSKECFFQKHAHGRSFDTRSQEVHYKDKSDTAIIAETKPELLHLIQSGAIEIHAWGAQFSKITKPDLIVFDLDPESMKLWPEVVETAHHIRDLLQRLRLQSFVKVTGGKGLHIQVPIAPQFEWDQVKDFSHSLMKVLAAEAPQKYTTVMSKERRTHRIFLDYLRNGYGATAVLPYSVRARETPTIAAPISWRELKASLMPYEFTIKDIQSILKRKDPWSDYWNLNQKLSVLENKKRISSESRVHV